jgi:Protein of unknown function (DUF3147)
VKNMLVSVNMSVLTETKWYQYAIRFMLGGIVTVLAGVLAKEYGPSIGGLFLAFPAIFPASATLIEKHERERKEKKGLKGMQRARNAVAADAAGATIGSVGLIGFGYCVWKIAPLHHSWTALLSATGIWLVASIVMWYTRKRHFVRRLVHFIQHPRMKAA